MLQLTLLLGLSLTAGYLLTLRVLLGILCRDSRAVVKSPPTTGRGFHAASSEALWAVNEELDPAGDGLERRRTTAGLRLVPAARLAS